MGEADSETQYCMHTSGEANDSSLLEPLLQGSVHHGQALTHTDLVMLSTSLLCRAECVPILTKCKFHACGISVCS